jgi:hypothetical protein
MQYGDDEHYYPEPPWDDRIRALFTLPMHSKERMDAYTALMAEMPIGPQRSAVKGAMFHEIYSANGSGDFPEAMAQYLDPTPPPDLLEVQMADEEGWVSELDDDYPDNEEDA